MTSVTFANPLEQAALGPAGVALPAGGGASDGRMGLGRRLRTLLPSGVPLADDVLARRHRALYRLLAVHIPTFLIIGGFNGHLIEAAGLLTPFVVFLGGAILTPDLNVFPVRAGESAPYLRLGAICVSTGLAWSSFSVIALSGGNLTAHLHLLLMVSAVALYQDAVALVTFLAVTTALVEGTSAIDPTLLFGHADAHSPYVLSAVDVLAVVGVAIALVAFWRATELQARASLQLATALELSELSTVQTVEARKAATSSLLTHLARRNQSLLARQISQLTRLDAGTASSGSGVAADGALAELQHLAGRMRRNAENLLVLSGEESKGRFGRPESVGALLARVTLAAPDPQAVKRLLRLDVIIAARAAADLGHLLEELLANAVAASSGTPVTLEAGRAVDGGYLVVVIDHGVGMDVDVILATNTALAQPEELDVGGEGRFGFQVIARLCARHGFATTLARGQGGGTVAMVNVPEGLITTAAADQPTV